MEYRDSLPVLVVEWSNDGVKAPVAIRDDEKICAHRWKALHKIAFMPLGGIRMYAIRSLHNSLHYEIPFSHVSEAVRVAQKLVAGGQELTILQLDGRGTVEDKDFVCRYDVPLDLIKPICWEHLNAELFKGASVDVRRNVVSKDYGFCGWKNAVRKTNFYGLAHPRLHSGTEHQDVQKTFLVLSQILAEAFPTLADQIYQCKERNRHFAGTIAEGNNVETVRHAGGIVSRGGQPVLSNFLSGHCDAQNEKEHCGFMWVCSVSMGLYCPRHSTVSSQKLITYGKAAAGQFVKTQNKFAKHLRSIKHFWDNMDSNLKEVTRDLIQTTGHESNEWTILPSPHSMKTVLYSVNAAAIRKVVNHFSIMMENPWYIIALLYCVLVSNCPQHFFNECSSLISDPHLLGNNTVPEMSPLEFGNKFYYHLFQAKKTATYPAVARRQPSHTIMATPLQVNNSIRSLGRMILEARSVPSGEMKKNTRFYYQRCVAYLCQECPKFPPQISDAILASCQIGVFSAGSLTAQEIIGVAAILGVLPLPFAFMAEVGHTTQTFRYLVDQLENSPFTDQNHTESTTQWIMAVSHLLGITAMQAEEVTCKWVQFLRGTTGRFKDSIPRGIEMIFPDHEGLGLLSMFPDGSISPTIFLNCTYDFEGGWRSDGKEIFRCDPLYWQCKPKDWTRFSSRKTCGSVSKEPSLFDFFPLQPHEGISVSAAKACGKMQLATLSPQAVIESLNPPLPGYKQNLLDVFGALSLAKFGHKPVDHKLLFCVVKKRFHTPKTRRKSGLETRYYSAGISMKGGNFDQLSQSNQETYFPPECFPLCRAGKQSLTLEKRRWFHDLNEAKEYACLCLIFERCYLFAHVSSLWDHLLVSNSPPKNMMVMDPDGNSMDSISTFNVMTHRNDRKRPVPHMVCVRYSKGGIAYYLVDSFGSMDSELLVHLPRNSGTRLSPSTGKMETLEFLAIADHSCPRRTEIQLHVVWKDGLISKEPISRFAKENYYSVYCYAVKNKLVNEIGWKKYCKCPTGKTLSVTSKEGSALHSPRPKRQRISDNQKTGAKISFSET
jgi:hypothetical protein